MYDLQRPSHGRWIAAAVVAHTLWTSAAPAMTYPLYAEQWDLTATMTAVVFATYPAVVVLVMLFLGNIGDDIGLKRLMMLGMIGSIAGVAVFAAATDFAMLVTGRILMGVGVGLSAGPSAASLTVLAGDRGASMTVMAQSAGFAGALVVGGLLTQYAPFPLRTPFILLDALLIMTFAALARLRLPQTRPAGRFRLTFPKRPPASQEFSVAVFSLLTAYSHGVITTAIGARIAADLVKSTNAAVNGLALSLFPVAFGLAGLLVSFRHGREAVFAGSLATIAGMILLLLATGTHSLTAFVMAIATSGFGYAFLVFGGLRLVAMDGRGNNRSSRLTWALMWAYVTSGILALTLGELATRYGFDLAVQFAAAVMVFLALSTIRQARRLGRGLKPTIF